MDIVSKFKENLDKKLLMQKELDTYEQFGIFTREFQDVSIKLFMAGMDKNFKGTTKKYIMLLLMIFALLFTVSISIHTPQMRIMYFVILAILVLNFTYELLSFLYRITFRRYLVNVKYFITLKIYMIFDLNEFKGENHSSNHRKSLRESLQSTSILIENDEKRFNSYNLNEYSVIWSNNNVTEKLTDKEILVAIFSDFIKQRKIEFTDVLTFDNTIKDIDNLNLNNFFDILDNQLEEIYNGTNDFREFVLDYVTENETSMGISSISFNKKTQKNEMIFDFNSRKKIFDTLIDMNFESIGIGSYVANAHHIQLNYEYYHNTIKNGLTEDEYLSEYRDVIKEHIKPLSHFLEHEKENLSPFKKWYFEDKVKKAEEIIESK